MIVESSNVLRGGEIVSHQLQICDDTFIPGLERLSGVIKSGGARALVQLNHGGAKAFPVPGAGVPLSASTVPITHGVIPRSMTTGEIGAMVSYFAEAARRSVEAGFDGVEIQGCHFYLLSQFLSPFFNRRTDESQVLHG